MGVVKIWQCLLAFAPSFEVRESEGSKRLLINSVVFELTMHTSWNKTNRSKMLIKLETNPNATTKDAQWKT